MTTVKVRPISELYSKLDPELVDEAKKEAAIEIAEFELQAIREELKVDQMELAKKLGKSQPTLSKFEKKVGVNSKLGSIVEYLAALGCEVSLDIKMPSGESRHLAL